MAHVDRVALHATFQVAANPLTHCITPLVMVALAIFQ